MTPEEFWDDHAQWSNSTFGDERERGPIGPLKHLEKEAVEAQEATNPQARAVEIADCYMLILDAARRNGMRYRDLVNVAAHKLAKNKLRTYPKGDPNEPSFHTAGE